MSTQYEILSKPDAYAVFFKVQPTGLAPEAAEGLEATPIPRRDRLVRARRMGGFIRAAANPLPPETTEPSETGTLEQTPAPVSQTEEALPAAAADALAAASGAEPATPSRKKTAPPVQREWVTAQWGLVPHWVKSASDGQLRALKLTTARQETASTAQAFRDAWLANQRCIVPMMAFYEDDCRNSGKPVSTRISRVDGLPMGVAGLWARWVDEQGQELLSYALLTVNANSHALMRRYQNPGAEKRMPAILSDGAFDAWLGARQDKAREFMRAYPANWLTANPVERKQDKQPKAWLDGGPGTL